jgi:hypothetical protein
VTTAPDEILGAGGTDDPREPLRASGPGEDPEQDLGEPQPCAVAGDSQVARQRKLEPATEREPFDGRDHGARNRAERVERGAERRGDARPRTGLGELRHVGARGERLLVAGDHRLDVGIGSQRDAVGDLVEQRGGQGSAAAGRAAGAQPVVLGFEVDERVGHAISRSRRSRGRACGRATLLPPCGGGAAAPSKRLLELFVLESARRFDRVEADEVGERERPMGASSLPPCRRRCLRPANSDSSIRIAESTYGTNRKFTMKPARSCERMTRFSSRPATNSSTRFAASSLVTIDGMSSTRCCTGTGLKKCSPSTFSGRRVAIASFMIGIDDVFDARIVSSPSRILSTFVNKSSFSSSDSMMASMMS